jgi:6-phosphogluconolactonase (cycloisomerase 2 family)
VPPTASRSTFEEILMTTSLRRLLAPPALALAAALAAPAQAASTARIGGHGHVYSLTNDAAGNALLVYDRGPGGTLTLAQTVSTGGLGTGAGLGTQGAVTLSQDGLWLFAVNAGSDTVAVLSVDGEGGVALVSTVASGGHAPSSVTERAGVVYVLNTGVGGNIAGFRNDAGTLAPLADGVRALSDEAVDVGPAEVAFDRLGRNVVVTEKNTNLIDTWPARPDGRLGAATFTASAGTTPFGFIFDPANHLLVSEAAASTMSSYRFPGDMPHVPEVVSAAVPTGQVAACWATATPDGRLAFTADAGSGAISSFEVDDRGALTLAQSAAEIVQDSHPLDMVVAASGKRLFVLNTGNGTIASFAVGIHGRLHPMATVGVPATAAGLAID